MRKQASDISSPTHILQSRTQAILAAQPDDEAIAKLAYQLWAQRGRPEGSAEEDWYRAQDILRSGEAHMASTSQG
jgi:hypothetical protein